MGLPRSPQKTIREKWRIAELEDKLRELRKIGKDKKQIEALEELLRKLR
jgi:hypothetical protein